MLDEISTLGIIISGLGLMIGFIRPKVALNLVLITIVSVMMLPFVSPFIKGADSWLTLILVIIFVLLLFQWLTGLIFGQRAADSAVGSLIANILLAPFRLLIGFFRALFFRRT